MRHEERTVTTRDGTSLRVTAWSPEEPARFLVLVSHGQSEHMGRHRWLAEGITRAGGVVLGPDHRGEGRSGGRRGHADGFETYAADLAEVVEAFADELPPGRCARLLYGQSMGGLIGLLFLLDHGERLGIRGAVISAPLLELVMEIGFLKRLGARLANVLAPTLPIPNDLPPEQVLSDPVLIAEYSVDPDRARAVTPRWVASMEAAQARVAREVSRLELPMLWYGGTRDRICSTPTARRLLEGMPRRDELDQRFEVLEGVQHEPHNEPPGVREPIRERAIRWLVEHARGAQRSSAPRSPARPAGRGRPSRSSAGAPREVPRSMAGLPGRSR